MATHSPEHWGSFEMPFKHELEKWSNACEAYDNQDFESALQAFHSLPESSRIDMNIGLIFADLGDHASAIDAYVRATTTDKYLAVAFYQMGVSHFMLGEWDEAIAAFDCAFKNLRGNDMIDYTQLGLTYKLYACEVIFNRGMSYLNALEKNSGLEDLYLAKKKKQTSEHEIIDDALRACGEGYSVYSIPPGVLYRPPPFKLRNMVMFDYFATTKVISPMAPIENTTKDYVELKSSPKGKNAVQKEDAVVKGSNTVKTNIPTKKSPNPQQNHLDRKNSKDTGLMPPEQSRKAQQKNMLSSPFLHPRPAPKPFQQNPHAIPPKRPSLEDVVPQRSFSFKSSSPSQLTTRLPPRKFSDPNAVPAGPSRPTNAGHARSQSSNIAQFGRDQGSPGSSHPSTASSLTKLSPSSSVSSSNRSSKVLDTSPLLPVKANPSPLGRTIPDPHGESLQMVPSRSAPRPPPGRQISVREGGGGGGKSRLKDSNKTAAPSRVDSGFHASTTPILGSNEVADSEMVGKIKLKAHLNDETRILLFPINTSVLDVFRRVQEKFSCDRMLKIKYRDEDGELVGIVDEEDWKVAKVVARQNEKARNRNVSTNGAERVEVWCF